MSDTGIPDPAPVDPPVDPTVPPAEPTPPPEPEKLPAWRMQLEAVLIPQPSVVDPDNPDIPTDPIALAQTSIAISLAGLNDAYRRSLGFK